jgi:hypothetical protein
MSAVIIVADTCVFIYKDGQLFSSCNATDLTHRWQIDHENCIIYGGSVMAILDVCPTVPNVLRSVTRGIRPAIRAM